ncbi:MAG: sugar ABC transporter permease [Chloroflexota bacterium]|nr:sugar ABC transporter permease [Chloroflexota bacterium]
MYRGKYRLIIPFLLPSLVLYALFVLYPYAQAMYISLTDWSGLTAEKEFVGLRNFARLIQDEYFWNALKHNAIYLVTLPLVVITLAFFFAFVITQGVRLAKFYRIVFFFPQVMSVVAVGVLWSFVYHPSIGILNSLLTLIGIQNPPTWLGDLRVALPAVGAVVVWQSVGFYMVFFIAGMESIPETFYEVARIEGASGWQTFWRVTFPLMWENTRVALVYLAMGALSMFTITQTMTEGGPSRATDVLAIYLYENAFTHSRFGYATAIAVALFILVLALSMAVMRVTAREAVEY